MGGCDSYSWFGVGPGWVWCSLHGLGWYDLCGAVVVCLVLCGACCSFVCLFRCSCCGLVCSCVMLIIVFVLC